MKTLLSRVIATAIVTISGVLGSASVQAEAVTLTLADLLDDGSVVVGDKLFDNFDYDPTGDMPDADDIEVIPINNGLELGLRFQGNFQDIAGDGGSEALLTYDVTVLDPDLAIASANLSAQLNADSGFVGIIETFLTDHPELGLSVSAEGESGLFSDSVLFGTPPTFLHVQKNIAAFANEDVVSASYIDQTFVQTPEPTGIALFLMGGIGAAFLSKRRRRGAGLARC